MTENEADLLLLEGQAIQCIIPNPKGRMSVLWQHGYPSLLCLEKLDLHMLAETHEPVSWFQRSRYTALANGL